MLILDEAADPPIAFRPVYPGLADPAIDARAPDADQWKEVTDREMEDLKLHDVYELVPRTKAQTWMGTSPEVQKWPFREEDYSLEVTTNLPVSIKANRSRPVVRLESFRIILALAAIRDLDVIQFDITSAHLHGTLKGEVCMSSQRATLFLGRKIRCGGLRRAYTG